jgi:hypothetical protein
MTAPVATRRTRFIVLAIVIGVAMGLCVALALRGAWKATRESPQQAVLSEAERLLNNYHAVNGRYPETLEELQFKFAGDGRPETLKLFQYQSDGEHYALVTHSVATGEEMKSCR